MGLSFAASNKSCGVFHRAGGLLYTLRACPPLKRRWARSPLAGRLGRRAETVLPLEPEVARLAGERELGVLLELVHLHPLLLPHVPGLVGQVRRFVAPRLAWETAVGVAHGALVVTLERVEVCVRAGFLRVPLVEHSLLRVEAPDAAVVGDVETLAAAHLN